MGEFWAAIAGAVVGGIIAFVIQIVALHAAAKDRREDTAEKKKALGYALLFKLMEIHSHFRAFNTHLKSSLERATKDGHTSLSWQVVIPFANLPRKVDFSTDEMAMLLSLNAHDVFNRVVSLDAVHNSTIDVFQTYRDRRAALGAMFQPEAMRGDVGTVGLTEEQLLRVAPYMIELNSILDQIIAKGERDERESWDALARVQKTLQEKIGLGHYRLELMSDAEIETRDQGAADHGVAAS